MSLSSHVLCTEYQDTVLLYKMPRMLQAAVLAELGGCKLGSNCGCHLLPVVFHCG